jgi:hypothetical protein
VQIKNRQQFLTILTLTAVGLLAIDRIISPPLTKLWNDRSREIATLKTQVHDGELMKHRKDYLRTRWAEIQASSLPNDMTAAEQQFYNGLNRWLSFSYANLAGVAPTWKPVNDPTYKTLECRVDVAGSIDQVARFLYSLETDPMALKVQSIEMTAKDANGTTINMGVQVSALVLTSATAKK